MILKNRDGKAPITTPLECHKVKVLGAYCGTIMPHTIVVEIIRDKRRLNCGAYLTMFDFSEIEGIVADARKGQEFFAQMTEHWDGTYYIHEIIPCN